jgi:hypothetical protein
MYGHNLPPAGDYSLIVCKLVGGSNVVTFGGIYSVCYLWVEWTTTACLAAKSRLDSLLTMRSLALSLSLLLSLLPPRQRAVFVESRCYSIPQRALTGQSVPAALEHNAPARTAPASCSRNCTRDFISFPRRALYTRCLGHRPVDSAHKFRWP